MTVSGNEEMERSKVICPQGILPAGNFNVTEYLKFVNTLYDDDSNSAVREGPSLSSSAPSSSSSSAAAAVDDDSSSHAGMNNKFNLQFWIRKFEELFNLWKKDNNGVDSSSSSSFISSS